VTEGGEVEYEVECIRDSRTRRGKLEYLVHWKGYSREEDTWEPAKDLKGGNNELLLELIDKFHKEHPSAPKSGQLRFQCHEDMTIRGG
jgi:hypothetical protein